MLLWFPHVDPEHFCLSVPGPPTWRKHRSTMGKRIGRECSISGSIVKPLHVSRPKDIVTLPWTKQSAVGSRGRWGEGGRGRGECISFQNKICASLHWSFWYLVEPPTRQACRDIKMFFLIKQCASLHWSSLYFGRAPHFWIFHFWNLLMYPPSLPLISQNLNFAINVNTEYNGFRFQFGQISDGRSKPKYGTARKP